MVRKFIMTEWGANLDYLDDDDYNRAVDMSRERFLEVCFITKADRHRVGDLVIGIFNEYTRNSSSPSYPKTLTKAYEMIINYKTRPQRYDTSYKGGLTFLNDGGGDCGGHGSSQGGQGGRGYGGQGRGGRDFSSRDSEEIMDEAKFLLDRVNNQECDVDAYLDITNTEMLLQQSQRKLSSGWIIMDSASTVCSFF